MSAALSPIPPARPDGLAAAAAAGGGAGDDDDDDDPSEGKNFKPLHALYTEPTFPEDEEEEEKTKPDDAGGDGPHKCYICERAFRSAESLHGHMRAHPKRKWRGSVPPSMRPGVENDVADSLLLLSGSGEGLQRKYVCEGCKREFDTRQALGGHRASHRKRKGCYSKKKDTTTKKKAVNRRAGPAETKQEEQGGGRVGAVKTLAPPEAVVGTSTRAATRRRERKVDLNAPPPVSSTSERTTTNNNSNNGNGNGSSTSGEK